MNALTEFDTITGEVLPPATGLYAAVAAQLDKSISTARAFPRTMARVGSTLSTILSDEKVAESCIYSLKRGGRTIQGPSSRFAELVAYAYGHLRIDARLVEEGKDYIVVRGEAHDLQTNTSFSQDVTRRIVDSRGKRYDVDLISVTFMAAASIAQRDCILKTVPSHLWRPAFEQALQRITGDVKTLADRRVKAIGQFAVLGVSAEQVFRRLGVASINDVTGDHLVELVGTFQAIKAGDTSVEAEFGDTKIPSRGSNGSPLAAPEDKGAVPEAAVPVERDLQEGAAEQPAAAEVPPVPVQVEPPAAQVRDEIERHPLTPQSKEVARMMAESKRPAPAESRWGPFASFEDALKQYEVELRSAVDANGLRAIAAAWGAKPYWGELDEAQAGKVDAAYEATKGLLVRKQKEALSNGSKAAYEAARAPEGPPPPASAPEDKFAPYDDLRPGPKDAQPIWESIVSDMLKAKTEKELMAAFDKAAADGRIGKLPQADQYNVPAIRFRIKRSRGWTK